MTRNDDLFDIKYVKFDADEAQSLIGKNVFVSSSLVNMREAVNEMDTTNPYYYGQLISANKTTGAREALFKIDCDDREFKYMYYDPYYELKCALKRGETIEYNFSGSLWEVIDDPVFNDKPEYYRVKPALKWQDLKIGDMLRGPISSFGGHSNDFYGMVTMIDARVTKTVDHHIYLGTYWIMDKDMYKFRRVNTAGEDIE